MATKTKTSKPPSPPARTGRPPMYNQAMCDEICRRIAADESVTSICKDSHMPCFETVRTWLREDGHPFLEPYARARRDQAHATYSGIQDIEQDVVAGRLDAQEARVIIDARKWRAGKMRPKVYGDKIDVGVSGGLSLTRIISDLDRGK